MFAELLDFVYYGTYTWGTTGCILLLVILEMGALTIGSIITSGASFTGRIVTEGVYCLAYWSSNLERFG